MQHTTRSLLVAFGSAAALVAAPLVLDTQGRTAADEAVTVSGAAIAPPASAPLLVAPSDGPSAAGGSPAAAADPASTTAPGPVPSPPADGRAADPAAELLPGEPSPQCPITEEGAWWTDPADPSTCQRPGSRPFFEPTPPGIAPELLEPIFEDPATPGAGDDCRITGALQCVVEIMGQDYVVTFSDGVPVGVAEARG
ncbi:hypothetical protein [Arthrobacter sp. L77]|uniref:hypothetical protein n=1 Tax=Arthrobacter sp. L77 TaxID=1496689 RepID=UPI0012E0BF40|nr:hypothetical protein [Arthrobacter sp. L77]